MDALIFAPYDNPVRDVMVAGKWRVREGRHPKQEQVKEAFINVQKALWD